MFHQSYNVGFKVGVAILVICLHIGLDLIICHDLDGRLVSPNGSI